MTAKQYGKGHVECPEEWPTEEINGLPFCFMHAADKFINALFDLMLKFLGTAGHVSHKRVLRHFLMDWI